MMPVMFETPEFGIVISSRTFRDTISADVLSL
jgi:hypothetical protein